MKLRSFNSIKVQLRQLTQDSAALNKRFQFHKGTIKTTRLVYDRLKTNLFQFHKGTIKTFRAFRAVSSHTLLSIP